MKYNFDNKFNQNFLITIYNINTREGVHIIAIYKPPKMQISYCISILETNLQKIPINCQIIIIGKLNIIIC
jgi:hypothetical protein